MIEFLTSAIVGGLIYDTIKKGTLVSYDIANDTLSKYIQDHNVVNSFAHLLDSLNIDNSKSREEIIDTLESSKEFKNILHIVNSNITFYQNANTINNYINNKQKKKPSQEEIKASIDSIPYSMKVYRNLGIDYFFIPVLFFVIFISSYLNININPLSYLILALPWYIFIHYLFPSTFITIFKDKVLIGNDELSYLDIRTYSYKGNSFYYKLHNDDKNHVINLYSYNSAEFLYHKVDMFAIETGIKLH